MRIEEKEALGQACQAAETMMRTVMQISQSSALYEEQEKNIFKTSLVNYRHRRWCPAVSSFLLILIPFQVATGGRKAHLVFYLEKWLSTGAHGGGESCEKGRDVKF